MTGDGTVSVDLDQSLSGVEDAVGNELAAAFTAGEAYDVDQTAPSVVSIVRADANPTNASMVNFTVTFDESVTGVAAANFTVDGSGVTGTVGTVTGSGTTWNVPVESVTGDGTVSVDLDQALSGVEDAVGNALAAAYTAGEAYDVDQTAPSSSASVDDWTRAGAAVLDIDFASSDAGSGVASTVLYVKEPGSDTFADTGLSEAGDSGTFSYAPPSGLEGLYEFATVATDNAGNAESAPPAAASAVVLLNDEENTTFTQAVVTGDDVLVFPMTDALDTTITLSGATAGSTVTVVRHSPRATPPAFFSGPLGELLDESLSIEGEGLGSFTATIEWGFDAGSAPTMDQVWQFSAGTLTATYPVTPSGNVLTIPGVTGFSDWFSGNGVAVPVGLSTFSID